LEKCPTQIFGAAHALSIKKEGTIRLPAARFIIRSSIGNDKGYAMMKDRQ